MTPFEGALGAIDSGWAVFPLARGSKLPAIPHNMGGRGCLDATLDLAQVNQWNIVPDLNWGIGCGPSNLVVIDIDPKNGGSEAVLEQLPASFTVRTPSGGWHVYFEGRAANRQGLLQGVDVRGEGGYVVAPGSVLASGCYAVERALPVAKAPDWLLSAIGTPRPIQPSDVHGEPPEGMVRGPTWVNEARAHLRNLPPAVKGEGGAKLFAAAALLQRGWLLDRATADALLRSAFNPRCSPPWDFAVRSEAANWEHTLDRAVTHSDVPWGENRPRLSLDRWANHPDDLKALEAPAPGAPPRPAPGALGGAWTLLEGSLMGAPQSVERALKAYRGQHLRRAPGTDPELTNSSAVIKWLVKSKAWTPDRVAAELGRDAGEFAVSLRAPEITSVGRLSKIDQLLSTHELLWNEMALCIEIDGEPWTDVHTAHARLTLEQQGASDPEKPIPNGDIEQRARALAVPYHPVEEYLGGLPPWDGVARVDLLWSGYFGAEDCRLNRQLSACFAIAAVRRVLEPGVKADMMPILYGRQGAFKSSGLAALVGGPPFFTDAAPGFSHRSENAMTLAGCWVWEIAEMQGMDRADQNAVKAFVTRREDDVLLPYARAKTRLPRRSITIGTTNDDLPLNDPTGSRRHPVIAIGTIDIEGLRRDRDQIWAEARARCAAGEPHWLSAEAEAELGERNIEHTLADEVVISRLEEWFALPPEQRFRPKHERRFPITGKPDVRPDFTTADALEFAFDGRLERSGDIRIGRALRAMGVTHRRFGKKRIRRYAFP